MVLAILYPKRVSDVLLLEAQHRLILTMLDAVYYGKMLDEYLAQSCGRDRAHPSHCTTPATAKVNDTQPSLDMDMMMQMLG